MSDNRVYPTVMHHPHHQAAILSPAPNVGSGQLRPDNRVQAVGEKLPPVTVYSRDDESYYESKGYVSQVNDPVAFSRLSRPALPVPPPVTVNGIPAEKSTALVDPDGAYPRWVGDEIARSENEEWEICQRTGLPFEGRGGSRHEPTVPGKVPGIPGKPDDAARIDPDEWAAFQAWKANRDRASHPRAQAAQRKSKGWSAERRAEVSAKARARWAERKAGAGNTQSDAPVD